MIITITHIKDKISGEVRVEAIFDMTRQVEFNRLSSNTHERIKDLCIQIEAEFKGLYE